MLSEIRRLFAELLGGEKSSSRFDRDDYRVAAAALLVHVATLDEGELAAPVREKLRGLLMVQFDLTDALTHELIEPAVAADREAIDFYQFTSLLMRTFDEAGRLRVVEMLWEIAFADGVITDFEHHVLWRVADLLAVSPHDRIALRQRIAEKRAGKEKPNRSR
jgi:uncharacterized tellurite resistance protein B-like protein